MKSLKVKLVSIVSAFILALSLLIVGVWAVGQSQTITMEGSVNFNVADKSLYVKDVRMQEDNNSTPYSLIEQDKFMPGYINGNFNMDLGEFTNDYGTFALYFDIINTMDESTGETFEYTVDSPTQPSNGTATITILDNNGDIIERIPQGTVKPSQITDSTQVSATIKLTVSSTSSSQVDLSEITITINQFVPEVYDYFTFEINEDKQTVTLTDYTSLSDSTDVVIPSTVSQNVEGQWIEGNAFTVTAIAGGGVFYNSGITSVELPSTLTSIGGSAFYNCNGLTSITFPSGLTSIGDYAFSYCSGLTTVDLSNCTSLKSIGGSAFSYCSGLTAVDLSNCTSLTRIGDFAFDSCSSLASITLPSSLTSIGLGALNRCGGLESITVEEGNSVYHSEGNCMIETDTNTLVFGCNNSTIPSYITSIGDGAFLGCSGLTSITLPSRLTGIGESAFNSCSGLTSITLPEGLTRIEASAFYNCYALAEVYNYSSLTLTIGSDDKGNVAQYAKEVYNLSDGEEKPAPRIQTIDNMQYYVYEDDFIALVPTSRDISSINLDSKTTEINQGAFYDFDGLTTVDLSNYTSLTSIGSYAFYGCSGLTSITLPEGLTSIGDYAFQDCSGLTTVNLNNCISLTSIGYGAFLDCSGLTSITLPEGLTSIEGSAFYGCSSLTSITLPEGLTSIGDFAFQDCSGLTSITLPEGLKSIGDWAFYDCSGLTTVDLSNCTNLTSIGDYAFQECSGLTGITLPSSLKSIGNSAFKYCSGLTSITLPEGLTSIGGSAFYGCSSLTGITLPSSLKSIGNSAFYYCSGLTSITLPEGITSIGNSAFYGCSGLTSITLPSSLTSIGYRAFRSCNSLDSVAFANTATTGWYVTEDETATSGEDISVSDSITNATYLKNTYVNYYWKRNV